MESMRKIKLHKTGEETEVGVATAGHMVQGGYATFVDPPVRKVRTKPQPEIGSGSFVGLSKADLIAEAESRGLDTSGTKADLVDRLGG